MRKIQPWAKRLTRAKKAGHFTKMDHRNADRWPSCAVGERIPALRDDDMRQDLPWIILDRLGQAGRNLETLGFAFGEAVTSDNIRLASNLYKKIQSIEIAEPTKS